MTKQDTALLLLLAVLCQKLIKENDELRFSGHALSLVVDSQRKDLAQLQLTHDGLLKTNHDLLKRIVGTKQNLLPAFKQLMQATITTIEQI